jgi:hypothetical protein
MIWFGLIPRRSRRRNQDIDAMKLFLALLALALAEPAAAQRFVVIPATMISIPIVGTVAAA